MAKMNIAAIIARAIIAPYDFLCDSIAGVGMAPCGVEGADGFFLGRTGILSDCFFLVCFIFLSMISDFLTKDVSSVIMSL